MRTHCVAAILAALSFPAAADDLTPAAMRSLLEGQDVRTVVPAIDDGTWTAFLGHVEAGHRGWIDVVPNLASGTNDRMSARLVLALSRALTANPAGVLSVMSVVNYNPGDICGAVDADLSVLETVHFIDAALVKVAAVMEPDLVEARNACLFALGAARIRTLI